MSLFRYEGLFIGLPALFYHTGDDTDNSDGFHEVQVTQPQTQPDSDREYPGQTWF